MKFRHYVQFAILGSSALLLTSCATTDQNLETKLEGGGTQFPVDNGPAFREERSASVVMRFYRWDSIFIVKPDNRQDGFLHTFKRDDLGSAFKQFGVRPDMAVVVVGWTYQNDSLTRVITDWKQVLADAGFKRVVLIRGGNQNKLDGMPVFYDWKQSSDQAKQTASL